MEENTLKIDSIYEEKLCICGHYSVDRFTSLPDTFIKYKNELVSFIEIVRQTLNFEPSHENCSMEICEQCKLKLQELYIFKMRCLSARNALINPNNHNDIQETSSNDPLECSLLDIIRDYIKICSVKSIEVNQESKTLTILGKSNEQPKIEEISDTFECNEESHHMDEDPEYLEEFLDDDSFDAHDYSSIDQHDTQHEKLYEPQDPHPAETSKISKRPRHPDKWACNKRKRLRNLGMSYLNSKGKIVSEKKMLEPCLNCRSQCSQKISQDHRLQNFNNFWKLGDVTEQRKFIYSHILTKQPIRRRSTNSNRSVTMQFYLDTWDDKNNATTSIQVCKKMFKTTLAVSNQVIQGVVSKYSQTADFKDPRGKHRRKVSESQQLAQQHVQKFPFFYIEQTMTKIQLYNMYVDECKLKGVEPVKESQYREIFDKFNANSFLKAKKVLCEKCDEYRKATEEEKILLQKDYNEHLRDDKKCRDRALGRVRQKRAMEKKRKEVDNGNLRADEL